MICASDRRSPAIGWVCAPRCLLGIRSHVADDGLADALNCPPHQTRALAQTPTRLKKLHDDLQQRLINWGFAICDIALRRWVMPDLEPPQTLP